jgi:hypothetical protein
MNTGNQKLIKVNRLKIRLLELGWKSFAMWSRAHGFHRRTVRTSVHKYFSGYQSKKPWGKSKHKQIIRALKDTLKNKVTPTQMG